jgi:hypothetical protein
MNFPRFSVVEHQPANASDILAALADSPAVKVALDERAVLILKRRTKLAQQLSELESTKIIAAFTSRRSAIDDAVAKVREAETVLQKSQARVTELVGANSLASFEHTRIRDAVEAEMRATAHPCIGLFISEMTAEWDRCKNTQPLTGAETTTNQVTGKRVNGIRSNVGSIVARMNAIREAQARAEAMRLDADQIDVPQRLEELRAALPKIEH